MKAAVRSYWEAEACGAGWARGIKYSRTYFDEIELARYAMEPGIFSFAQFTRAHGLNVLEVGVGAGTDFIQWVRAGAQAYGVDITHEAIEHVRHRLTVYGFSRMRIGQADAEALPYPYGSFDIVYSWGVIHHTPETSKALDELVRVCRPGGTVKLMVYNRHSLNAGYLWLRHALLVAQPWRSLTWVIAHRMESVGTKSYTASEIRALLRQYPVENVRIQGQLTRDDRLHSVANRGVRFAAELLARILGTRFGWFMTIEFTKIGKLDRQPSAN